MPTKSKNIPAADLHTPEELLGNAEALFASGDPKIMRAVILEAITAFEAYVQATVFPALENKMDISIIRLLEEKTKMDFDSRLSVLVPAATGKPVDKGSMKLWNDYKTAKNIRNKVTHIGSKVSQAEARFVINMVYGWLGYLGTFIEFETSLIGLKSYVETTRIPIKKEGEAIALVAEYYGRTKAAVTSADVSIPIGSVKIVADVMLRFGLYTTLIESKFLERSNKSTNITRALHQLTALLMASRVSQGALLVFQKGELSPEYATLQKYRVDAKSDPKIIYLLGIKV